MAGNEVEVQEFVDNEEEGEEGVEKYSTEVRRA